MIILFHPQFSATGSSRHVIENDLIKNWNEFVRDVSNGMISTGVSKSSSTYIVFVSWVSLFTDWTTGLNRDTFCFP